MPSTSFKKSWVLSISGATNALERVDLALDSKEADAKVIQPLIEALWWVCAADESLTKEYPAQWPDNLRPSLPELPVLKGLRWVRNRATHQISQWEIAKPPFQWEDASIIAPPASVKRGRDHGRAEYTAYLQGHDARDAIKTLSEAITREAIGKLPP